MWKAIFLAIGIMLVIVGAECLVVEQAVMVGKAPQQPGPGSMSMVPSAQRVIQPPEWAPWSLMSAGAVVVLYSFTLPRRVSGE